MATLIVLTIVFFVLFSIALGLSSIFGRGAIKGTCGGLNTEGCQFCSPEEREECKKSKMAS